VVGTTTAHSSMMGRCSVGARVIKDRLIPWIMMIMRVEGY